MKSGMAELRNDFKWRTRRYWGGMIHGIGIGIGVGLLIALRLGWNNKSIILWIIIMIGIPFIGILGRIVLGKPPKPADESSKLPSENGNIK